MLKGWIPHLSVNEIQIKYNWLPRSTFSKGEKIFKSLKILKLDQKQRFRKKRLKTKPNKSSVFEKADSRGIIDDPNQELHLKDDKEDKQWREKITKILYWQGSVQNKIT